MKVKDLAPEVRHIWKVAKIVQGTSGFALGLEIFIFGPLVYEKLAKVSDPKLAMTLTAALIGICYLVMILLEAPTGAIGDAIGRKWAVIWSLIFRMFFFAFLAFIPFANSLALVFGLGIAANICFGLSYTFFSGNFTAWCVDSLRERAPEIGYEHLLSKAYTYSFLARLIGGVLSIFLYLWKVPSIGFVLGVFACMGCVAFCLGEMEEPKNVKFVNHKEVSLTIVTRRIGEILGTGFQVFRRSPVILTLVILFATYKLLLNIVDYLWPVYLRAHVPENIQYFYWVAMVVAVMLISALSSHALTFWMHRWHKKTGARAQNMALCRLFVGICIFAAVPILILSWLTAQSMTTLWSFGLSILPLEFAMGFVFPCYETLVNNYIPEKHSEQRATIMSFGSLICNVLIALLVIPSAGSSGATTTVGWAIPAALLIIFAIIGHFVLKKAQRKVVNIGKELPEPAMVAPGEEVG